MQFLLSLAKTRNETDYNSFGDSRNSSIRKGWRQDGYCQGKLNFSLNKLVLLKYFKILIRSYIEWILG